MVTIVFWALISLLAYLVCTCVYVVAQAIVGMAFGARVEVVSIGFSFGKTSLFSWPGRHWKWQIGYFPFGGFTKFPGEQVENESGPLTTDDSGQSLPQGSLLALSLIQQILVALSGPVSQLVIAGVLLALPVVFAGDQIVLTSRDETSIQPVAVGGIAVQPVASSLAGQQDFATSIVGGALNKYLLFQPLDGWGGFVGCFLTLGAAAANSWPAWITCFGTLILLNGLSNLLPVPSLSGFRIMMLCIRMVAGRNALQKTEVSLSIVGLLVLLVVLLRVLAADLIWIFS